MAQRTDERPSPVVVGVDGSACSHAALRFSCRSVANRVLGSRGHGTFTGILLGSVSQHCVQHAPCPVVVIPPPRPA